MEVGKAVTYVDPNGNTQDALLVGLANGRANIVVVNVEGASDPLGKNRSELVGIPVRAVAPCVVELDTYEPPKKKKKAKKTPKDSKESKDS